jgi:hypothetical protein
VGWGREGAVVGILADGDDWVWCAGLTRAQEVHLAAVMEILQSIRQADMSPMLGRIYKGESGSELLDTLMKYMYVMFTPFCAIFCKPRIASLLGFVASKC